MDLFPEWMPVNEKHQVEIFHRLKQYYPDATAFVDHLDKEGGLQDFLQPTLKDALEKLIFSGENVYLIDKDYLVAQSIKKYFDMDLDAANLASIAPVIDYASHGLTKHSPWTPIISLGFKKMEEKGMMKNLLKEWLVPQDEFHFSSTIDGIPFGNMSLLFIFLAVLLGVSCLAFLISVAML